MSAFSPFQFLPQHIVRAIVNHVVGSSRVWFDFVRANSNAHRSLLRPMLWICHNFRAIALPLYCSRHKIYLYGNASDMLSVRNLLPRQADADYRMCNYLGHPTHHLARELVIELDERSVYSGKALRMLSHAPYDGCPFLQARKLTLTFVSDEENGADEDAGTDLLVVKANVVAFVQRIEQMAPAVSEIRVQPDCTAVIRPFGDLVSRLFRLVGDISYSYIEEDAMPVGLRLDMIRDLVHIKYDSEVNNGNTNQFIQLARQNALTLQSLCILFEEDIDVAGLVQQTDGQYVTYPCLLKLRLHGPSDITATTSQRHTFRGAIPFPNLRCLSIRRLRPFDDDTLFRGSAGTLESVEMELTGLLVSMLRQYSVFTPDSHPKLQCVNIWYCGQLVPGTFASAAEATQFALGIGPKAPVRELYGVRSVDELLSALSLHGEHTLIQVLSLRSTVLELASAVALIKSLPLLTDLYATPLIHRRPPSATFLDAFPTGMVQSCATGAPINERLRCLHFAYSMNSHYIDTVACVLLLALMCPRLDYVVPVNFDRGRLTKLVEECIACDLFRPYATRLHRLLFCGWSGGKVANDSDLYVY